MRTLLSFFFLCFSLQAQNAIKDLEIHPLEGNFYVFTHYHEYQGQLIGSNGLYVVTKKGVILIDTPWNASLFQPLLDSIWQKHQQKVVLCIATHYHEDRTAGLEYFRSQGIKTYTSAFTRELSIKHNEKLAEFTFEKDTVFQVGDVRLETFYPGEGHTPDNIVIWFPKAKILYGGCFIKSIVNKDLGPLTEKELQAWSLSLQKTRKKYPNLRQVIPGHWRWEGKPLEHTLELLTH